MTDKQILSSKPQNKQYQLYDGKGFLFMVPTGTKLWRFNYIKPNSQKRTVLGIGSHTELSKTMAREIKNNYRKLLANNIDSKSIIDCFNIVKS